MRLVDIESEEQKTEEESFEEMKERHNREDLREYEYIRECLDNGNIVDYNGFRYVLQEDDTYAVALCLDKTLKIAEIPKICNGKPVTTIERTAFISVGDIESDSTFNKPCVYASYSLRSGLPHIHASYFGSPMKMSNSLECVILPDSITKINYESSDDYDSLYKYWRMFLGQVKVKMDPNNPVYKFYKGGLYDKRSKTLLYVFSRKKILTVLEGTKKLADWVFSIYYDEHPTSVIIPSSVKEFGKCIISDYSPSIKTIFYKGTKSDWKNINRPKDNAHLFGIFKRINVYFYRETPSGDSWCYAADNVLPEITHTTLLSKLVQILNKIKYRNN